LSSSFLTAASTASRALPPRQDASAGFEGARECGANLPVLIGRDHIPFHDPGAAMDDQLPIGGGIVGHAKSSGIKTLAARIASNAEADQRIAESA
jgi:hypothetical protein